MYSTDRLRDIRNLEFHLFGGMSQEEFYSRDRPPTPVPETSGIITGYAEFDPRTGEINCHNVRTERRATKR